MAEVKKIVAVNASPRTGWNTDRLVREAEKGAQDIGCETHYFNLYKLEQYTGCRSCFGCMLEGHEGHCVVKDGLTPVLDAIRESDGLIIGTPNYFSEPTAAFRALFERLVFQYLTYERERVSSSTRKIPVLFIMTSNAPLHYYDRAGYTEIIDRVCGPIETHIGPVTRLIASDTLQVNDYSRYKWTYFDAEHKKERHEKVFPQDLLQANETAKRLFG
ncbi:MAG: flavodoxin family protein [Oscillospiraceae bacterium]|nr:flavodoxin family protein [Oscillospiraceae bacterium]